MTVPIQAVTLRPRPLPSLLHQRLSLAGSSPNERRYPANGGPAQECVEHSYAPGALVLPGPGDDGGDEVCGGDYEYCHGGFHDSPS